MPKLINRSSLRSTLIPWFVLIFLFALNFASAGGYLLLILMAGYFLFHLREFSFRFTEIFLFVFGVEYFLFYLLWYQDASIRELCNYLVAPWLLYWIGRNMGYQSGQNKLPLQLCTILTLGFFSYGLLCIAYSMFFSPPSAGARVMYKFWDQTVLSVTAGGLLFSLAIGMSLGHLTTKNSTWTRLFWLAVLAVCLYYAFTWAHRTSIYIIIILIVWNCLTFLFTMKASPVRKFALLSGSIFVFATLFFCLVFDIGGCFSWLQEQWIYQRITNPELANSQDRFTIWRSFFEQWLLYPFGGKQFRISSLFVHNLWLDVYYLCGILPFIALVIVTLLIIRNLFLYRKIQAAQHDLRSAHIVTNCYLAVFLAFMVEPVMDAYPYIFLAILLLSGSIDGVIINARKSP